jgi:HEPN domain-containing protein
MFEIDDEVVFVVRQWVQKAENDLKNAAHTLMLGAVGPTDTVCFHAQQCVEKYLKALLVLHGIEFARVHHVGDLINRLPLTLRPDLTPEEQEVLTDYAVSTRYPGDYERIPLAEARCAVQIARRVRKQIRRHLPAASLKPL